MCDPDNVEAYEILVDPERKSTLAAIVDGFLDRRLSDDQRKEIGRAISGARA